MRRRFALSIILLAGLAGAAAARAADSLPGPIPAIVLRTIDGDTLLVRAHVWLDQEIVTRVRLAGIDAPEMHGQCPSERAAAQAARTYLSGLVRDGAVALTDIHQDKYGGRVVARAAVMGRDLSAAMLAADMARPYTGGKRRGWC
ncbi:MAG: thermonuclease family protein [Alphaproteobacteria bacterium]|nr:thermonuclease family protein [Alphaproteobacteria bacterium]